MNVIHQIIALRDGEGRSLKIDNYKIREDSEGFFIHRHGMKGILTKTSRYSQNKKWGGCIEYIDYKVDRYLPK